MTRPELTPDDHVFVLETDRQTWISVLGRDETGAETRFRLAFTSLDKAKAFAAAHPEIPARRVRELRLGDVTGTGEPPLALDLDPAVL